MHEEFNWISVFEDGSVIYQFLNKKETNFSEVLKKKEESRLRTFTIENDKGHTVIVDLTDGSFYIDGKRFVFDDFSEKKDGFYKLVFYKRNQNMTSTVFMKMRGTVPYRSYIIGMEFIGCNSNIAKVVEVLPYGIDDDSRRLLIRDEYKTDSWGLFEGSKKEILYKVLTDVKQLFGWYNDF
uniref:Uncharacterized protein n=1 Tax=viral metagenome TaxID=1070528 RepID=A0A6M3IJN7_9ZZZZ